MIELFCDDDFDIIRHPERATEEDQQMFMLLDPLAALLSDNVYLDNVIKKRKPIILNTMLGYLSQTDDIVSLVIVEEMFNSLMRYDLDWPELCVIDSYIRKDYSKS